MLYPVQDESGLGPCHQLVEQLAPHRVQALHRQAQRPVAVVRIEPLPHVGHGLARQGGRVGVGWGGGGAATSDPGLARGWA